MSERNKSDSQTAPLRERFLLRGESLVASLGAAAAAIVLAVAIGAAWWALRANADAQLDARRTQVRSVGGVLSRSAESLLGANELSSLRRLLIDTSHSAELATCRIVLPDGKVVADADPTRINIAAPPKRWASGPVDAVPQAGGGAIALNVPLMIAGRGAATLQLSAAAPTGGVAAWEIKAGLGLIGAAGLASLLLVYRHVRAGALTLGLIREALLALGRGETAKDALALAGAVGPEAAAWNLLLSQAETLRGATVTERARGALSKPREGGDLEHACDSLSVGLMLVDSSGRLRHANGAAASLLQLKRNALNGAEFATLVTDESVRRAVAAICAGSGKRETIELIRGESIAAGVLRIHVRPLRREDGSGALVTLEDVTQQRVAEASRNAFITQTTHELRTPLTNMRLCLETALEEENKDPAAMAVSFNVLNRETRRLERMVGEMLSVAEIEAGSMTLNKDDVKLDRLFAELDCDYRPMAEEKQIALSMDLPPKMPEFSADRDRLTLALHNLVGNAIKYTPANGRVMVGVREDATRLYIDVTDTGIGINEQELNSIFDRFYRAKDPRVSKITGSGLGLALARDVARLHGGDITVQSEFNKGSTFTLNVPLNPPPARTGTAQAA